jgi:hypothetical protein
MDGVIDQIVLDAKEFIQLVDSAESDNRNQALSALRFAAGDQWPANIKTARDMESRPCLTINKTDSFVRQVCNNMRQQRPRIVPHPVGDGADVDTAEVIKGLIKHIEAQSGADIAYDTASDFQVRMGWGYWRVNHKYISEDSFDQDIYIEQIDNPFQVYFDPFSVMPDGSDAESCAISKMMRRKDFKKKWPKADPIDFRQVSAGDVTAEWANEKEIRIVEYWRIEKEEDTLVMLSNGWKGFKSEMDKNAAKYMGLTIEQQRPTVRRKVMVYRITAKEVLEKKEWAGKYIPIVPVYGMKLNVDGKVDRYGMVKNLIDPAQMYNFWRTSEAELVALAPKAPWVMAEGQDEGHETEWDSANTKTYSRLVYKPVTTEDGSPLPAPQRQQPQQIPAANVTAANNAAEDMKAVAGIYDPSMGDREGDPSGVALGRHQQQSEISNFHFYDNQCRSLRWTGILILDLIPKIYDTQRVLRCIGEDGEAEGITINEKVRDELGAITKVLNDVTVGRYDVVMDTGPGYNTRRMETAENMMALLNTPLGEKIATVADDVVVRHFDWTGSRDLADRLAAANPLAQAESIPDMPPEAQAIIKQLQAQVQQMQQQMQQMQLEEKYKINAIKLKEHAADGRHLVTEQNENERLQYREQQENERHIQTLATKTHDIGMRDATKRHDTEFRGHVAQTVAEIRAMTDLLMKHIDGSHLEKEIEAEDRRTAEMANKNEPVTE